MKQDYQCCWGKENLTYKAKLRDSIFRKNNPEWQPRTKQIGRQLKHSERAQTVKDSGYCDNLGFY